MLFNSWLIVRHLPSWELLTETVYGGQKSLKKEKKENKETKEKKENKEKKETKENKETYLFGENYKNYYL